MSDEDLIEVARLAESNPEPHSVSEQTGSDGRPSQDMPSRLREDARACSKEWTIAGRVIRSAPLEAKLERATADILDAGQKAAAAHERSENASEDGRSFANNLRLLRQASLQVRPALRFEMSIPQLSNLRQAGTDYPRPYVAARAYLSAVDYLFEEGVFTEYMRAFQEAGAFEMQEIWALKPMMQLASLECVAAKLKFIGKPAENANDNGSQPDATAAIPLANLIKSFHRLSHTTLQDAFSALSKTEAILCEDPIGAYVRMDLETCDLYRSAIQELVMASSVDEFEIARLAVELSQQALTQNHPNERDRERRGHVGFYLLGRGRRLVKQRIRYRAHGTKAITETFREAPDVFYFLTLELLLFVMMFFVVTGVRGAVPVIAAALLLILPASESAVEVMNQVVTFLIPARALPRLDFSKGLPADCLTIVAVPTLLINEAQIKDLVRSLEIRYVGNRDPQIYFALLTDPPDSEQRFDERDQLVSLCSGLIEALNRTYGREGRGPFLHFHRHRVFNETENKWMGWERKRGKLLDFNDFLRGQYDRFPVKVGDLSILPRVRYVITLDSDTQLPRESAYRLVATLAHPLNRASVNPATNTVDEGYGVLQPRVGISVQSANRSRLAYIYSGQTGLDIYARAVSDVYQDLFGEGIFTGKGIYEVDVFRQVLSGRFPSNAILSHDLIEGAYARAGLVSDVEIIDDYPSHFSAHSRRKHRWIRGDWQILRWLLPRVRDAQGRLVQNPLDVVSRWKILDNLRRSVIESATFVLLLAAWFYLPGSPGNWTAATVALMLIPSYVQLVLSLSRLWRSEDRTGLLRQSFSDFTSGQITVLITLTFLAHQTLTTLDAIFRTVFRLTVSKRHLLEWETAAQSEMDAKQRTPVDVYLDWTPVVGGILALVICFFRPAALLASLPILTLWILSKPAASWLDRPLHGMRNDIGPSEEEFLRLAALRTWRYFREMFRPESNWLIPDNVYEEPFSVAHRLSPTNLGLQLNAQFAAYDLGFIDAYSYSEWTEKTLASARRLPRFRGHFLNWFDTMSLTALPPRFVSSVDSGNLACSLWCLKHGSLAIAKQPIFRRELLRAVQEHLDLAVEECKRCGASLSVTQACERLRAECVRLGASVSSWIGALVALQESVQVVVSAIPSDSADASYASPRWWLLEYQSRLGAIQRLVETLTPWMLPRYAAVRQQVGEMLHGDVTAGLTLEELPGFAGKLQKKLGDYSFWTAEHSALQELSDRLPECAIHARELTERLSKVAEEADLLVHEMDFRFLYNRGRKMLSVGYDVEHNELAESCYDLLASEARSAVFVAIAKGDIPQNSWFQLGRVQAKYAGRNVLLSWTGTMFEYLMPMLWMRAYPETLLENSMGGAVAAQRRAVDNLKIPWGISEGACRARNDAGHFEYHAFGVRNLALKPDMIRRLVITPYAAFLALNVDPANSVRNLRDMHAKKWVGPLGFYESADYGCPRRGEKPGAELVRSWMAHHQGMSLLSVANLLSNSVFQRLFHSEVMVASTERILHERKPSATNCEPAGAGDEWAS
jgi:cyclic beta-1,2-glucan glucanotransferase